MERRRACVVVLGDLGRSPRMQYQALSLARQANLEVDIVAYGGSQPHSALLEHKSIHVHTMTQWPKFLQNLPWIFRPVTLLLKPLIQFLMLLWFLIVRIHSPAFFIVQNPPSVPTLIAVKWASILKRSAFIIDWHNFGHTLLALSLGRNSSFVAVYRWIEKHFGKMADGSFCVTKAMQHELAENWDIKATVFYDQPPEFFHVASLQEKHELFCRLHSNLLQPLGLQDCVSYGAVTVGHEQQETLLTSLVGNGILLKQNRPAVVVSSTSWTPDEDFSILLEAAVMYDRRVAAILNEDDSVSDEFIWKDIYDGKQYLYPRLLFIITGKGPDKEKYEDKISKLHLKRVAFRTMWLSPEDYPLLLGSADLGVCLHTSSSGLDLPMKVVDMFGCGLPVCAVSYSCINELVKAEKNGLLFSSSSELADELLMLFRGFPNECSALDSLKNSTVEMGSRRWSTEWDEHAKPLISQVITRC
ncbi:UDP-glycosyltransferase TURAN isoform X2 [Cucurbita pepo subsp. pepo]|uniref:UDP-glycosyltransferase TURAN isoform X2 n=1 Tax=Cucurbita pepo subsp. pepo TaxID=3664 RepID=UPI000C9DA3E7|nr:UDP-glycosyltransferase TURAN isoform X2 [Cucurbita pepo subsp. pepo]